MATDASPLQRIMSRPAVTVPVGTSLAEAAETMLERGIGSLPCVDREGRLVGIVTNGDFGAKSVGIPFSTFRAPQLLGRWMGERAVERICQEARHLPVDEIMSAPVHTVDEEAGVEQVLELMLRREIKHVPVVRDGYPVGMVARHDILKLLMDRVTL